jgi:DNA-binding transcriptional MerR regulator
MTIMNVFEKVEGVAKRIGVAPSTVKKYYLLFEQEGYRFKRSHEGYVLFSDHDIDLLKELMFLKNQSGMTVQKAVKEIVQHEGVTDTTDIMDTKIDVAVMSKQVATVMTEMAELKQLVKEQNELIKQQQKYINERLEERDRKLMESLRESQEERKVLLQIAAAQEEKKQRKGIFKFFSKG